MQGIKLSNLDVRIKILSFAIGFAVIFAANNTAGFTLAAIMPVLFLLFCWPSYKGFIKFYLYSSAMLIFYLAIYILFSSREPGSVRLFSYGFFTVTREALTHALLIYARVSMMIAIVYSFISTTKRIDAADGLGFFIDPFSRIKLPAREFIMALTLSLQFAPIFVLEQRRINEAQSIRSARKPGSLALLLPLFISSYRRADGLADLMDARGFVAGQKRGRLKPYYFGGLEVVFLIISVCLLVSAILVRLFL
ncbi:MAG: energy-coupling factor transporter transmembrane protein EcfT [Actinobacteria bacterium]|nr:energy-coupling factor transporter transmembrane protein EcfT [Actinomycetota bacterium]